VRRFVAATIRSSSSSSSFMAPIVARIVTVALRERARQSRTDYANGILISGLAEGRPEQGLPSPCPNQHDT
jgi:hypothetical protein